MRSHRSGNDPQRNSPARWTSFLCRFPHPIVCRALVDAPGGGGGATTERADGIGNRFLMMSRSSSLKFWSRSIFGIAIFTSAFLLFQVQLLLGKFLLPWFGGTSAVMGDLSPVFSSPVAGRICI